MKKWIAMLLATVLLLNMGCALADVDTEITFQDIPWGSSKEDVYHIVLEKGLAQTEDEYIYESDDGGTYLSYNTQYNTHYWESNQSDLLNRLDASWNFNKEKKIAGYNLDRLNFSFITEKDETHLIYVEVMLDWKSNAEEAYADLQQKLTTVYGEGFHQADTNGILNYYLWKGSDNTAVMLSYNQYSLHLYYGMLDVDERLAQIEAQIEPVDHDDTSGL